MCEYICLYACRSTSYEGVANREGERLRELGNKPGFFFEHEYTYNPCTYIERLRELGNTHKERERERERERENSPGGAGQSTLMLDIYHTSCVYKTSYLIYTIPHTYGTPYLMHRYHTNVHA
jgi:hypothetical protein